MFDEDVGGGRKASGAAGRHELGMVLDGLSVEELTERIGQLEAEIERLRAALVTRDRTRTAADAVFKF